MTETIGTPLAAPQLVSLIVPFYNEEKGLDQFWRRLMPVLGASGEDFELICVDDGSSDATLDLLIAAAAADGRIRVIELSRNFGKEAALTAGLDHARGAAVIPLDADLQDPPELIPEMLAAWRRGADVVLARRADRSSDSPAKRRSAALFYRFHNLLSDVPIPENAGDFRLMDRSVVEALKRLPERQRFMKGLFAWVGFKTATVEYVRPPRAQGLSRFSGWRLWNLALEGITSFSTVPLRIWTYVGLAASLLTFLYGFFIIVRTLIFGIDVPGYASLFVAVLLLGSLQMVSIGILGEYLGRVYLESKQRPPYLVRREYGGGR
jgi:polyisoprenyl-phosphate glycosyltransferase